MISELVKVVVLVPGPLPTRVTDAGARGRPAIPPDPPDQVTDEVLAATDRETKHRSTDTEQVAAMAATAGTHVLDVPSSDSEGLAGVVGIGYDDAGQLHGMIGLADDLDDGLRADVLTFRLAMVVGGRHRGQPERVSGNWWAATAIGTARTCPSGMAHGALLRSPNLVRHVRTRTCRPTVTRPGSVVVRPEQTQRGSS